MDENNRHFALRPDDIHGMSMLLLFINLKRLFCLSYELRLKKELTMESWQ